MSEKNKKTLKKAKHNSDKITSQNATDWKLFLFWILFFEVIASVIEFLYVEKSISYSVPIPHTIVTELLVACTVTAFVWFCIYNIIFENKNNIFKLATFSIVGIYFVITNDFTLQFLMLNLNPFHFFDLDFGVVFFIELFFKLIITYLLYQLLISFKNTNKLKN
jgi:uncharacterized membrane protein